MKKIIAFASVAALGLGVAACGSKEEAPAEEATTEAPMVEETPTDAATEVSTEVSTETPTDGATETSTEVSTEAPAE